MQESTLSQFLKYQAENKTAFSMKFHSDLPLKITLIYGKNKECRDHFLIKEIPENELQQLFAFKSDVSDVWLDSKVRSDKKFHTTPSISPIYNTYYSEDMPKELQNNKQYSLQKKQFHNRTFFETAIEQGFFSVFLYQQDKWTEPCFFITDPQESYAGAYPGYFYCTTNIDYPLHFMLKNINSANHAELMDIIEQCENKSVFTQGESLLNIIVNNRTLTTKQRLDAWELLIKKGAILDKNLLSRFLSNIDYLPSELAYLILEVIEKGNTDQSLEPHIHISMLTFNIHSKTFNIDIFKRIIQLPALNKFKSEENNQKRLIDALFNEKILDSNNLLFEKEIVEKALFAIVSDYIDEIKKCVTNDATYYENDVSNLDQKITSALRLLNEISEKKQDINKLYQAREQAVNGYKIKLKEVKEENKRHEKEKNEKRIKEAEENNEKIKKEQEEIKQHRQENTLKELEYYVYRANNQSVTKQGHEARIFQNIVKLLKALNGTQEQIDTLMPLLTLPLELKNFEAIQEQWVLKITKNLEEQLGAKLSSTFNASIKTAIENIINQFISKANGLETQLNNQSTEKKINMYNNFNNQCDQLNEEIANLDQALSNVQRNIHQPDTLVLRSVTGLPSKTYQEVSLFVANENELNHKGKEIFWNQNQGAIKNIFNEFQKVLPSLSESPQTSAQRKNKALHSIIAEIKEAQSMEEIKPLILKFFAIIMQRRMVLNSIFSNKTGTAKRFFDQLTKENHGLMQQLFNGFAQTSGGTLPEFSAKKSILYDDYGKALAQYQKNTSSKNKNNPRALYLTTDRETLENLKNRARQWPTDAEVICCHLDINNRLVTYYLYNSQSDEWTFLKTEGNEEFDTKKNLYDKIFSFLPQEESRYCLKDSQAVILPELVQGRLKKEIHDISFDFLASLQSPAQKIADKNISTVSDMKKNIASIRDENETSEKNITAFHRFK